MINNQDVQRFVKWLKKATFFILYVYKLKDLYEMEVVLFIKIIKKYSKEHTQKDSVFRSQDRSPCAVTVRVHPM